MIAIAIDQIECLHSTRTARRGAVNQHDSQQSRLLHHLKGIAKSSNGKGKARMIHHCVVHVNFPRERGQNAVQPIIVTVPLLQPQPCHTDIPAGKENASFREGVPNLYLLQLHVVPQQPKRGSTAARFPDRATPAAI